jgi:hypothetical protein
MAAALWTFDVEQHARLLFRKQVAEGLAARHPKENPGKANGPNALCGVPTLLSLVGDAGAAETISMGHSKENPATHRTAKPNMEFSSSLGMT